jgi:hypothetical protein
VKSGMYYKYMEDVYIIQLLISVEVNKVTGTKAQKTINVIAQLYRCVGFCIKCYNNPC